MSFKLRRSLSVCLAGLLLGGAALLAGCQVQPLYGDANSEASASIASVGISPAQSRVGQAVRNHLIFLTSGGAGEARSPAYDMSLQVSSAVIGVLLIDSSDTARAGQVRVTGTYTLTRMADTKVIKTGSRQVTSLVDFSVQEFAKARAIRDAENRAARELAELLRADLLAALSRP